MKKRLLTGVLALAMILQTFIPSLAKSNVAKTSENKLLSKELKVQDDNLITLGEVKGITFPKLNPSASIIIEKAEENKNDGLELGDEIIPQAVGSSGSPYIQGNQPADPDKPKYWANVQGTLTTKGIDGTTFDWDKVLGKGTKVKLLFTQTNGNVMTGVTYSLLVDKDGTYTWQGSDGKPTYLPLFDVDGNGYSYNVQIERTYSKDIQLIIQESNGTPKAAFKEVGDKHVATISFLDIKIQQVASTKFVSEWHTDLAETERPQIEGYFEADTDVDNNFNFPKNNTSKTVLRYGFLENFVEDEDNGPWSFLSSELEKTPKTVEVKTDTQGLTFEENNGVKTVKSGDHKFKYDFTYNVIDGGKLVMTEIIPVTFNANGGKFASIADPNAEQKIIKEVDYGKDLTDEAEKPTKDRETFKGWSTTQDGKTPVTDDDFKNIKEAKTFYAIWDNNDIQAEELNVKESFKDGTGYVNDFIPTLDTLKGQVKIKDAKGDPQPLTNEDKLQILDDDGNPIADTDLKDKLYEKLKEDDTTEVSRNVTLKAKVTHKNGTSQTVDIPIKVIKNIYEAKTEEGKPNYVPEGYVKVTVDPTTKATEPQKYFYYVNPKAEVVIPGKDPVGTGDNLFVKWTMKADDATGEGSEYKLSEKPRTKFEKASTITAQYSADVVPAKEDGTKPEGTPDNFVKVTFVPTDKATDETKANKIFYVNPDKAVTIPVENPVAKQYYTFAGWKIGDVATGETYTVGTPKKFGKETTITATYTESDNIIPVDPTKPTAKPEGYVTVSFDADLGLKLTGTKYYYVKANAGITIGMLEKPKYQEAAGYEFNGWDKPDTTPIGKDDIVVTAKAKQVSSPDKPGDEPGYRPYPEIIYRDRIVEKEKIVEKIVKVGENDELLKEIRYMQGYNGKFRPYDGLTRAEAAQILANALKADGYRYNANYNLSYTDVGNKWYTDAVRVVTQANVFQGYSDGTFRPQSKITRAEWVATLRRFQDLKEANGNTMMLRSGHWATAEVEAAYEAGWLGVYQDGTAKFDADKPITRQEVAYVSNRAFRRVLDKVYLRRSVNTLLTYKDINPSMPLYEDILCASNTLLTDNKYYKANTIVMDNVTFNIVTDYLDITQKKFQYNVNR